MAKEKEPSLAQYMAILLALFVIGVSFAIWSWLSQNQIFIPLACCGILVILLLVAWVASMFNRKKERTPEEQLAYNKKVAELEAEEDFKRKKKKWF
jgi:protein-S-isoprenylcysteine O-methyltransferase Ste14